MTATIRIRSHTVNCLDCFLTSKVSSNIKYCKLLFGTIKFFQCSQQVNQSSSVANLKFFRSNTDAFLHEYTSRGLLYSIHLTLSPVFLACCTKGLKEIPWHILIYIFSCSFCAINIIKSEIMTVIVGVWYWIRQVI